jgi:hypothetical protein
MTLILTQAFDYFFTAFFKVSPNSFTIKASSNKQAGLYGTTYYYKLRRYKGGHHYVCVDELSDGTVD